MLNFEYFDASGTSVGEGVFLPQTTLLGVLATELASGESTASKDGKVLYSINNVVAGDGLPNALGLSMTAGAIAGQSGVLSTKTYTFSAQYYSDLENQVTNVLPAPTIGDQVGVGDVTIQSLFTGAVKVGAGGAIPSAGVLIPTSLLIPYGSPSHATIDPTQDSRAWIASLIRYMNTNIEVRDASTASAITAKTSPAIAALILGANATDPVNPTTGLDSANLSKIDTYSKTLTVTIQRIENESNQQFDVNVVTA